MYRSGVSMWFSNCHIFHFIRSKVIERGTKKWYFPHSFHITLTPALSVYILTSVITSVYKYPKTKEHLTKTRSLDNHFPSVFVHLKHHHSLHIYLNTQKEKQRKQWKLVISRCDEFQKYRKQHYDSTTNSLLERKYCTSSLISSRILWPSRTSNCPSLLAVSHVVRSEQLSLTETALWTGPTADKPFDNAMWNWISPIPSHVQRTKKQEKNKW